MSGFNIGGYTSEKDSITVSSQDHAINEQGLPGNGGGGGPKKGKVRKPPIKITFGDGDGDRTTKPNGQDDGNPFPPKNPNNKEKPKDTTRRLGHITLTAPVPLFGKARSSLSIPVIYITHSLKAMPSKSLCS